jgi:phage recombination protein Bet
MSSKKQQEFSVADMRQLIAGGFIDAKDAYSDDELKLFARFCNQQNLDPFAKEAYLMKDRHGKLIMVTNYHVFYKRAQASGTFGGLDEIRYNERMKDGKLIYNTKAELVKANMEPVTAHCTVYVLRQGQRLPVTHSIVVSEYNRGNYVWKGKPFTMADKCVNAGAMRKGFPDEVAGLYVEEELGSMLGETVASEDTAAAKQPRGKLPAGAKVPTQAQLEAADKSELIEAVSETIAECMKQEPGTIVDALKKAWDDGADRYVNNTEVKKMFTTARQHGTAIDEMRRCLEDSKPGKHVNNLAALWKKNEAAWKTSTAIKEAAKAARELAEKMDANAKVKKDQTDDNA